MEKMTEYERRRLENIKRNDEMLAALKIQSTLTDLKRQRAESKPKWTSIKKPKVEAPTVVRRSLRARGVPPELGHVQMRDAYANDEESHQKLIQTITTCLEKSPLSENDAVPFSSVDSLEKMEGKELSRTRKRVCGSVNVKAMHLEPHNISRLVPGRIMTLRFFPTTDMHMVVVGNNSGHIGFWNVNNVDGDGTYVYSPHLGTVSGIVIDPFCISKMYSLAYDGFIRMMDVEKEVFDMVYSSAYELYDICLSPHDTKSLYFSEGNGRVKMWDYRTGKPVSSYNLHEDIINTIDFNSGNDKIMATSSNDGTACIWDLRLLSPGKPKSLKTVSHKRAMDSAYFSPTGAFLATTSTDNKVGLSSGANYEDTSMVCHYNKRGRPIATLSCGNRGIWGWDDSSVFIGDSKRGIDVISVASKRVVATLESDLMPTVPCRLDAHPYNVGMLVGATSEGVAYIWTL